ncbi:MAG TPA: IMPACT family protein [Cyclobacteriaceae bacterium]
MACYKTIKTLSRGDYKEKGSKFLGFAFPVCSEEAVKNELQALKKSYYNARHHCYAFRLGKKQVYQRASDDGEPNHSAGDPILGQIKSFELTNTLVVVVRYFGGTKLGVSGLINAYKTAAADALKQANIIEEQITREINLSYPYDITNEVMRLVMEIDAKIISQEFKEICYLSLEVPEEQENQLNKKIKLIEGLNLIM